MLITIQNSVKEVTMGKLKSPKGNIANAYRINPPTKTSIIQTCTKSKSENISNRFKATALNGSPMKTRSARRNSSCKSSISTKSPFNYVYLELP